MIESIRRFFNQHLAPGGADPADDARRLRVAVCVLLLEAAHADADFAAEERAALEELVRARFDLDEDEVARLLALAEEQRRRSTDLFQFTRLLAESYDRARKLEVLELLWRVIYSDGRLEAHEDALVHKLAGMLGLKHRELIGLKLKVKGDADGGRIPG